MNHTADYIINKSSDFKYCKDCNTINWYENESCWNCNSDNFQDYHKIQLNADFEYWLGLVDNNEEQLKELEIQTG